MTSRRSTSAYWKLVTVPSFFYPGSHTAPVWQLDLGPTYSYCISAKDNHPTEDRAHRYLPALPHNIQDTPPKASFYDGDWHDTKRGEQDYRSRCDKAGAGPLRAVGYAAYGFGKKSANTITADLSSADQEVVFVHGHSLPGIIVTCDKILKPADYVLWSTKGADYPCHWPTVLRYQYTTVPEIQALHLDSVTYGTGSTLPDPVRARVVVFMSCESARDWVNPECQRTYPSLARAVANAGAHAGVGFTGQITCEYAWAPIGTKYLHSGEVWAKGFFKSLAGGNTIGQARTDACAALDKAGFFPDDGACGGYATLRVFPQSSINATIPIPAHSR